MKTLENYVNGLRYTKSKPVSFRLHSSIGTILENIEDKINNTMQEEKVLPTSEETTLLL